LDDDILLPVGKTASSADLRRISNGDCISAAVSGGQALRGAFTVSHQARSGPTSRSGDWFRKTKFKVVRAPPAMGINDEYQCRRHALNQLQSAAADLRALALAARPAHLPILKLN